MATIGLNPAFTVNDDDIIVDNTYVILNINPIKMCKPVPPLTLRDPNDTPIRVNTKAANGRA